MAKVADIKKRGEAIPQPFSGAGHSGLKAWAGTIDEEFIKALKNPNGHKIYREMAENSPVIAACLGTIKQMMRAVDVSVQPADEKDSQAIEVAEFVESCLDDMALTWSDTLSEELSMLTYGWAVQETIYKRRNGAQRDELKSSKYTDGRIGWAKMAARSQDSLDRWEFDEMGGIAGMTQLPNYSGAVQSEGATIPAAKLLHFRTESHKDNPEGRSLLRGAYTSYHHEKHIRFVEGVGIERDLTGYPIIRVPTEQADANATGDAATAHTEYKKIGRNLQRDEQECLILSSERDETGNYRYDVQLLATGGRRQFDTNAIIQRLQREIALSMMADFVLLGHEKVGSFSLASSKTSVFALALDGWLNSILAVWNRCAIPRLVRLNGWREDLAPYLVHGDIESPDLAELGQYLSSLSSAGISLIDDEDIQAQLLAMAGLNVEVDGEVG